MSRADDVRVILAVIDGYAGMGQAANIAAGHARHALIRLHFALRSAGGMIDRRDAALDRVRRLAEGTEPITPERLLAAIEEEE